MFHTLVFCKFQEKIPIEEVFEQLKCTKEGLTTNEAADRIQIFGPNKVEEKKVRLGERSSSVHALSSALCLSKC